MRLRRTLWITAGLLVASALAGVGAPKVIHASSSTDPQPAGTLSVTGTGTVETQPDAASTSFGVVTQGSTAQDALATNAAETARMIDALKRAGVADKDIQTQYVSLDPQYDTSGSRVVGYSASNTVSATVRRLLRVGAVIDAGVAAGANNISGPSLSREDQARLYDEALDRAVAAAKAKARVLAKATGAAVGAVESVTESPQDTTGGPFPADGTTFRAATSTPIEPGTTSVTASVRIVFKLS